MDKVANIAERGLTRESDMKRAQLRHVACGVCGHDGAEPLHEEKNIQMSRRDDANRVVDVKVSICPRCGLVFLNPRMTAPELDLYYRNQVRRYPSEEKDSLGASGRSEQAEYLLGKIKVSSPSSRRIMDVGSFDGLFLSYFQKAGWEVVGVEPDQRSAGYARSRYAQRIISSNFEYIDREDTGDFDVIAMSHVLEHIEDPKIFISKASSLLKRSGYLFIQTPNMARPFISPFYSFFSFQHLYYYTPTSLILLLGTGGFKVLDVVELPYAAVRILAEPKRRASRPLSFNNQAEYRRSKLVIEKWKNERQLKTAELLKRLKDIFEVAQKKREKVAVYGAGYHTQSLKSLIGGWPPCVAAFADDNPDKIISSSTKVPMVSLEELKAMRIDTVIISSYVYQEMMAKKAAARGFRKIIKLYENALGYDGLI